MTTLSSQLEQIVSAPEHPENDFILSKYTHADIYSIAGFFQQRFFSAESEEAICLCTSDRAVMAGALLAALTRPVTLVIPHAFSKTVLAGMHRSHLFTRAIVSETSLLPPMVEGIAPCRDIFSGHRLDGTFVRSPDAPMVKLFTGGSTNTPRVWSKTVRNLFSESIHQAGKLGAGPGDRFAATVPAHHIYGLLFSVLTPLLASASVIDGDLTYPHEIQTAVSDHKASILVSTPLHYKMLSGMTFTPGALRFALSSAARLDAADSRAFHEKTGLGVTEIFGSTETGGIASRLCAETQPHFTPFDCIDWKIVDSRLAIRSDFISPELPTDPEGFFVTNDQAAAVGPMGFELAGRADRIVKVGGKRVDLDEIRSVITGMPEVADAAVISTPDGSGRGNEISALVATTATSREIRQYLHRRFQGHAVPRRIRVVDRIPVSTTGKYNNTLIRELLDA